MKFLKPSLLLAAALIILASGPLNAQSMIGLSKDEVRALVQDGHKEFRQDKTIVNQRFNYLKYVNGLGTQTWILYFTDMDICRSTKLVCDYGDYDEVLEELNSAHEKTGESQWLYMLKGDTIEVTLARLEWYFTVREARKN